VKGRPKAKAPPESVSINPLPISVVSLPVNKSANEVENTPGKGTQSKNEQQFINQGKTTLN